MTEPIEQKKRRSNKALDWALYENMYVQGGDDITLVTLSALPGSPSYTRIRVVAAEGKWTRKREEYRGRSAAKALERALESSSTSMKDLVGGYLKDTEDLKKIARMGIKETLKQIKAKTFTPTLTHSLSIMKVVSDVEGKVLTLGRDSDGRIEIIFNLFIDFIEESFNDPKERAAAVKRLGQLFEASRL